MLHFNPQKPFSEKLDKFYAYDMLINYHDAFRFNAESDEEAVKIASRHNAYELTRYKKTNPGIIASNIPLTKELVKNA